MLSTKPVLPDDAHGARRQPLDASDGPQLHVVLVELFALSEHVRVEERHERDDLVARTTPVLLGERVDRQNLDAEVVGAADDPAHGVDALPVAEDARAAALLGPPPVAVHDDGDVVGKLFPF
jgi:hypothetical protein